MAPPEHIDTVSVSDITAKLSDIRILKKIWYHFYMVSVTVFKE